MLSGRGLRLRLRVACKRGSPTSFELGAHLVRIDPYPLVPLTGDSGELRELQAQVVMASGTRLREMAVGLEIVDDVAAFRDRLDRERVRLVAIL